MLALAHGVKGLLFYNYLTDGSNLGMSTNTNLQNAFKYLAARLKGPLGNKLLSLRYQNNYLRVYSNTYEGSSITSSNSYSPISLSIASDAVIRSFHAGILNITNEQYSKFLFLVNLLTTNNETSTASFQLYGSGCDALYGAGTSYKNISLADLESSNIFSVSNGVSSTITMNNSEGKLFKVAPTVLIGRRITANETIGSAKTLTAPMTIAAGCTLTVSAVYTINSDITVEEGGRIVYTGGGSIVLANGAQIKQNVMAVDNSNALASNSQRKIVRDNSVMLHLVFESVGKVWYETSTDGGSTWVMRNGGQPISSSDSKSPSITVAGQSLVLISYQERNGNSYYVKAALYDVLANLIRDVSIVGTQTYDYSSTNSNPTIFCVQPTSTKFLVVWQEMDFGGLFYKYGSIATGPSISLSSSSWRIP